jgi:DHA1 family tetracycline resistance protein-like MFS transporter
LPRGFWVIWTTVVLDLVGFGIAIPVLPLLAKNRFGLDGLALGVLLATFSLAQLVAARPMGRLSDRIGRKPLIVTSLVGTSVGSFLTALAPAAWVLYVARLVDGASGASASVAQAAVADLAPPEERARLLGLLGAAFGIGFTIGPAIGGVAAWLGGPRAPFVVAGVVAAVNAVAAVLRLPETRSERVAEAPLAGTSAGGVRTWREGAFPRILLLSFLATFAFSAFEGTFALFADERLGFGEAQAAWAFAFVGLLVSAVQGGLVGPVVRSQGERRVLQVAYVAVGAGLVVMTAVQGWPVLLVALALLCVGQGLAIPALGSYTVGRIHPDVRAELLGLGQSASAGARVAGPIVGNVLLTHVSTGAPYAMGAMVLVVVVVLALTLP